MRLLTLFLLIFTVAPLWSQNLIDSKGKKQGPWSKTYPGSVVFQYKGQFKDDKPVGTFTYFYPSTKVKAIIKHNELTNRSEAFFYHENSKLMSYGIYRNMKKDSIWLNFGPSGRISNSETYKNDLLNGKKIVYFIPEDINDKSKKVSSVQMYTDSLLNGPYLEYFESGVVLEKGTFAMGKKNGVWERYHSNGKKMIVERYKEGTRHGWSYGYDESGKEVGKVYYLNGRKLQGKELEQKMEYFKQKGIDPNE